MPPLSRSASHRRKATCAWRGNGQRRCVPGEPDGAACSSSRQSGCPCLRAPPRSESVGALSLSGASGYSRQVWRREGPLRPWRVTPRGSLGANAQGSTGTSGRHSRGRPDCTRPSTSDHERGGTVPSWRVDLAPSRGGGSPRRARADRLHRRAPRGGCLCPGTPPATCGTRLAPARSSSRAFWGGTYGPVAACRGHHQWETAMAGNARRRQDWMGRSRTRFRAARLVRRTRLRYTLHAVRQRARA